MLFRLLLTLLLLFRRGFGYSNFIVAVSKRFLVISYFVVAVFRRLLVTTSFVVAV